MDNGRLVFERHPPTEIRITYVFECEHCRRTVLQETTVAPGGYIVPPEAPRGWYRFGFNGGSWMCPDHKIDMTITDENGSSCGYKDMQKNYGV